MRMRVAAGVLLAVAVGTVAACGGSGGSAADVDGESSSTPSTPGAVATTAGPEIVVGGDSVAASLVPALTAAAGERAHVDYLDPHVPELQEGDLTLKSVPLTVAYGEYDAVVIITDHRAIDYTRMLREAKLVVLDFYRIA